MAHDEVSNGLQGCAAKARLVPVSGVGEALYSPCPVVRLVNAVSSRGGKNMKDGYLWFRQILIAS